MASKICPILTSGNNTASECMGADCMLFFESSKGDACSLSKEPHQLNRKVDTLLAQVQEIQVALNEIANAALDRS